MSLAGTRLGPYDLASLVGAGGMGEVYRARDTKLGRDVAIKILPAAFAADPDRLARFEREARVLASLNHPHIAQIYGVEESSGVTALVLEFVAGETLAARLKGSRSIGVNDALPIARQIADALDAAHERGIVHRDLKPANIIITPEGTVKVLDFGLAIERSAGERHHESLTHSPTVIGPTAAGVLLGTAPYMSPEQARGKTVDKRTDIWAFGCVLYEMLTGRRAFPGETTTDSVAAILEREPDWSALPPSTPPHIVGLLRRCLEKDPKRRVRDIGDVQSELTDMAAPPHRVATSRVRGRVIALVAVIAAALAAALTIVVWQRLSSGPSRTRPAQFVFGAPDGGQLEVAVPLPSPDGARIAFVARTPTTDRSVWIRPVGSTAAQRIAGTEGVIGPAFWSPDGRWLGFFAGGKLKKIDPSGGPAVNICSIANNLGATWNRDNVIVVAPVNRTVLHKVSAAGGTPEPITTLSAERKENSHRWPHFLPDGRHFLFTARSDVKENNMIYVASLDSRDVQPLMSAQSNAVYAAPGSILYVQDGTLMARAFDTTTFSVSPEARPIAGRVNHNTPSSEASFGAAADGSVVTYLADVTRGALLTWFSRTGKELGTVGPEKEYSEIRLSPDGKTAAVVIPDPDSGNRDIWMLDLAVGTLSRFTSNPSNDWQVAWSPDGRRLAFASDRNGLSSIYVKPLDGSAEELLLRVPEQGTFPKDWSRDGRLMTIDIDSRGGIPSLWAMSIADRKPFPLTSDVRVRENEAMLRVDQRWMAFESLQTGVDEIYIAPFPTGARRRVSNGGGVDPRWKADGRELYYVGPNADIMAVPISGEPPEPSMPVRLFAACGGGSIRRAGPTGSRGWYDVTPDGSRFLVACGSASTTPSAITVSVDWAAAIK